MLVVAPRPEPTESLMGFILRLTELNGYPSTSYLLATMGKHAYQSTVGRLDAEGLAGMVGLDQGDIDRLTHRPTERPRAFVRLYGQDLPCYEVNLRLQKVCALCLLEGRPCEAFWDLAQASVCPIHRVALITHCPGCSKALIWARTSVRRCRCGTDLTKANVSAASQALCDLMAAMRHLVYRDETVAALPKAMSHLAHLDLRRFCKLLWVLSGVVHQTQGGERAPKARFHYRVHMDSVADALANWPLGFRTFLQKTYGGFIERAEELPHFRSLFTWLLMRLVKNDEGDGSAFELLERELYLFGAQHWTRDAMARNGGSRDLMPEQMRWGTIAEAGEATGLHNLTIKRRIASGEIKTRRVRNKTNRALLVDMDCIRALHLMQSPAVPIRVAAPMIGVSIETLRVLRATGALEENYRSTYPGCLSQQDVSSFAAKFKVLSSGKKVLDTNGVTTLDDAFIKWKASPRDKADIFVRLLANPSLVVGKKRGAGAGRLQILEETVAAHFRIARAKEATCLTLGEAATRLGCTSGIVTSLKRSGHIKTHQKNGRHSLCLNSVTEFDTKYEIIGRAAAKCGQSAKAAYAHVDFNRIEYIKLENAECTTIFVNRNALPEIEKALKAYRARAPRAQPRKRRLPAAVPFSVDVKAFPRTLS